ncbi:hypothetical protein M6B38_101385 [Iris pallida]|uniref:Uncharacterized protein n=1 Tax=Iris pallida TaxID=29817 RepID=A0AAX6IPG2_IRIPA|nr:hypothetical protein M6B38_120835 [Iris pallida]KAJ6854341.1 hypothetical protein M6B38_101385 [Iris pallida]
MCACQSWCSYLTKGACPSGARVWVGVARARAFF